MTSPHSKASHGWRSHDDPRRRNGRSLALGRPPRSRHAVALPPVNQASPLLPVEGLAVNQGPVLSPRSPPRRARSTLRRGARGGLRDRRERGAESKQRGSGGGTARENWPFYDGAPAVADRGSCKPPSPPELVGDFVWLPECNPLHNHSPLGFRSLSPYDITSYQRAGCSRRTGSGAESYFPICLRFIHPIRRATKNS